MKHDIEYQYNHVVSEAKQPLLLEERILAERLRFLFGHLLTVSFPSTILCASVVLGILYHTPKHKDAIIWYVITLSLVLIRSVFLFLYHKYPTKHYQHMVVFIFGSCTAAIVWGAAGYLLMPANDVLAQASIIIVLAGMTAGSTHSLQTSLVASMSFVVIAIMPLCIWLIQQAFKPYMFLDIAVFSFIIFMLVVCNRGYKIISETIKLRFEKMLLSDELMTTAEEIKLINIALVDEIAQRKTIEKKLLHLATHDKLTGLANRNYLETIFQKKLSIARQKNHQLAVLYLDLDDFKPVNDEYGHHVGDKLLIQVSSRLRMHIRANDLVARIGGDEFVIVLFDIEDQNVISKIASNLLQEMTKPFKVDSKILSLSACIGVSIYPGDGEDIESLIKKADFSLYQAKAHGRKNIIYYKDKPIAPTVA